MTCSYRTTLRMMTFLCLPSPLLPALFGKGEKAEEVTVLMKICSDSNSRLMSGILSQGRMVTPFLGANVKESASQCRRCRRDLWVWKIPWRREWLPIPVFLPRKPHGQRSLVGYTGYGVSKSWTQQQPHRSNSQFE